MSSVNKNHWLDKDFEGRFSNDSLRLGQFKIEKKLILKYISEGSLCDVGCSTGEFVNFLEWKGDTFGMEINEFAKKKAEKNISFEKSILNQSNFFDLVIFRGTIQHVDQPFYYLEKTFNSLKPGGFVFFLATPNTNSPLYKVSESLALIEPYEKNFFLPSYKLLSSVLKNYNFDIKHVDYPYWQSPYRNFLRDHFLFLVNIFSKKFVPHPFWKSMMNIVAQKPYNK